MFKIFKKHNAIEKEKAELKELEKSIHAQMNDLEETIKVAKEYLALCGYSEEDIERIRIRNRLTLIK